MKTQNIIRVLCGLSLLFLFCPFLKTCSFVRQEATEVETVSMVAPDDRDVLEHPDTFNTTIKIETPSDEETRKKNDVEDKREEVTASGWEFALSPFEDFPDKLFNFFLFLQAVQFLPYC